MQQIKTILKIGLLACALVVNSSYAQPEISQAEAEQAVARFLAQNPLYWNPFPFPYEIPQNSKHKDAKFLAALFKQKLVSRKELKIEVDKVQGRPVYELRWLYDYAPKRERGATEGFYYGLGKLHSISQISAVGRAKGHYYAAVEYRWQVVDFQPWAGTSDFKAARTLRRSKTSAREPFESKLYLHYNQRVQQWQVWDEDY